MDKMKIDIWSDIACPYCYIGKRKLEQALSAFAHSDEIELEWHSYELSPELPKKALSISFYDYFAEQHGCSREDAVKSVESVVKLADEVGLTYNFDKLVVANTSDALRLIKLSKKYDLADQAEEILFKAYFTEGKDVSDVAILIESGISIGLAEKEIRSMLEGNEYLDEIKNDIRYSEDQLDLQYIPFYQFNNKDIIQGSLSVDEYSTILENSYNYWKEHGVSTESGDRFKGRACSADGMCSL